VLKRFITGGIESSPDTELHRNRQTEAEYVSQVKTWDDSEVAKVEAWQIHGQNHVDDEDGDRKRY
jgi:hypothetical protein